MRSVWVVVDKTAGWQNIVGIFDQDKVDEHKLIRLFPQEYGSEYEILSLVIYDDLEMFQ